MYIDVKSASKEELIDYVEKHLIQDDFKITPDQIGKFIVIRMELCEKMMVPMLGIMLTSQSGHSKRAWGAFKIDWYNRKLFKDAEYKVKLTPIGKWWACMVERAWYNDFPEHQVNDHDAIVVEDPIMAMEIADKFNEFKIGEEEQ
jgi:hypothetical protein